MQRSFAHRFTSYVPSLSYQAADHFVPFDLPCVTSYLPQGTFLKRISNFVPVKENNAISYIPAVMLVCLSSLFEINLQTLLHLVHHVWLVAKHFCAMKRDRTRKQPWVPAHKQNNFILNLYHVACKPSLQLIIKQVPQGRQY